MSKPLQKLSLSKQIINLYPSLQSQIILSNSHPSYNIAYKIKTTKQHTFDVKPPKAIIRPGQAAVVHFKVAPSSNIMANDKEKHQVQRHQKFLLQVIYLPSESTKDQAQATWKKIKQKDPSLQLLGYGYYKLPIQLTSNPVPYQQSSIKKPQSKIQSVLNPKLMSSVQSNFKQFEKKQQPKENHMSDQQLSSKFKQLKQEQVKLIQRRQKIFAPSAKASTQSPPSINLKQIFILLIMLIIGFFMGNYLKTKFIPVKTIVPKRTTYWDKIKNYFQRG